MLRDPPYPGPNAVRTAVTSDPAYGAPRKYPWHLSENRIHPPAFRYADGRFNMNDDTNEGDED